VDEAAGFLLIQLGRTSTGHRALAGTWTPLGVEGFERQGRDHLRITGAALSSAVSSAISEGCGLAFVHSHPGTFHPSSLSDIDLETSSSWARTLVPMLGSPFVALVWTPEGLQGALFERDGSADDFDEVEVHGNGAVLQLLARERQDANAQLDERQ